MAGSRLVVDADVATEVTAPALLETWYELGRMATLPITRGGAGAGPAVRGGLAGAVHLHPGRPGLHAVRADRRRAGAGLAARAPAAAGGGDAGGDVRGGADLPGAGRDARRGARRGGRDRATRWPRSARSRRPEVALSQIPVLSRVGHDRAAERRTDEAWLAAAWERGLALVVTPEYTTAVVEQAAGAALALRPCSSVPAGAERYFLGLAGDDPVFAVRGPRDLVGDRWVDLREIGAALDDRDAGLLTTAVALARWHDRHPRCPIDGTPTGAGERRLGAALPDRRLRALPAYGPGGDHAGARRRGPVRAGPAGGVAGGAVLDPGRVRRAGGVGRGGGGPRGRRGGRAGDHRRRRTRGPSRGRSRRR